MRDDTIRLTRQELYDRIWTTSPCKLGPALRMSGRGLAKLCARSGVPVPGRGYWEKRRFGKAPLRPPLQEPWPPAVPPKPAARRVSESGQHELVVGALEHFRAGRKTHDGYLKPRKRLIVDVFASTDTLPRALDVANTLYVALEGRKHPVVIAPEAMRYSRPTVDEREKGGRERYSDCSWSPARPTVVTIGAVTFGLTIYELSENVEVQYVDGEYVRTTALTESHRRRMARTHNWTSRSDLPSGRLCLRVFAAIAGVDWKREWRETKLGGLLSRIKTAIREMEREEPTVVKLVAEAERQAELRRERWEAEQREWERRREEERRREAAVASRKDLFEIIEAWDEARQIEAFFAEIGEAGAALTEVERTILSERLKRARAVIPPSDALARFSSWKTADER